MNFSVFLTSSPDSVLFRRTCIALANRIAFLLVKRRYTYVCIRWQCEREAGVMETMPDWLYRKGLLSDLPLLSSFSKTLFECLMIIIKYYTCLFPQTAILLTSIKPVLMAFDLLLNFVHVYICTCIIQYRRWCISRIVVKVLFNISSLYSFFVFFSSPFAFWRLYTYRQTSSFLYMEHFFRDGNYVVKMTQLMEQIVSI